MHASIQCRLLHLYAIADSFEWTISDGVKKYGLCLLFLRTIFSSDPSPIIAWSCHYSINYLTAWCCWCGNLVDMTLAVEDAYSKLVVLPDVEVGISFIASLFRLATDWCCMAIAWSQFFRACCSCLGSNYGKTTRKSSTTILLQSGGS